MNNGLSIFVVSLYSQSFLCDIFKYRLKVVNFIIKKNAAARCFKLSKK